jgi:AcrR family transcriptional regulator
MTSDGGERQRLLSLVADHCLEHGIGDLTLRGVGRAIGTNNRMLLYYFGSKESLIAQALAEATSRYPDLVGALDLLDEHDVPLAIRLDRAWRALSSPPNIVAKSLRADEVPAHVARLLGREVVALWRGLQFDLISSGDRRGIDATHTAAATSIAGRAVAAIAGAER